MQEAKISVIIPVYNSEKFLEKCLDSVLSQNYDNLEIICVNDGSVDNSLNILSEYSHKDKRISIISRENSGVSTSRNIGLKNSGGDWITFIDSDDYISPDVYSDFINILSKNNKFDVYMYNGIIMNENENPDKKELRKFFYNSNWNVQKDNLYTFKDCKNPFYGNLSVANKIFKKDFLYKYNISFKENSIFEDQLFTIKSMIKANNIYINNKIGYYYIQHKNSTMHTIRNNVFNIFDIMNDVRELLLETKLYEYEKYVFLQHKFNVYNYLLLLAQNDVKEKFYAAARKDLYIESLNGFDINLIKQISRSQHFFDFMNLKMSDYLKRRGY